MLSRSCYHGAVQAKVPMKLNKPARGEEKALLLPDEWRGGALQGEEQADRSGPEVLRSKALLSSHDF